MKTENIKMGHTDYQIIGEYKITDHISILCGDRGENWKPRKVLLLLKNGNVDRLDYDFNKPLHISLVKGVNKENLQEALANGDAVKYEPSEMVDICKEIGYFHEPTTEDYDKVIYWLLTTDEGNWYYETIHEQFNSLEKEIMEDKDDEGLIKCFKELIEASPRIRDSILYLSHKGIYNWSMQHVHGYLSIGNYDDFVDYMYVSDSANKNNPAELLDKYDIYVEIEESEEVGDSYGKQEMALRTGEKYSMATITRSYIDDWNSFSVVFRNDIGLPYQAVAVMGESLYKVREDFYVKYGVVI